MNRHRALPPGDRGMRGAVTRWKPGCGGALYGAGGLVGRIEYPQSREPRNMIPTLKDKGGLTGQLMFCKYAKVYGDPERHWVSPSPASQQPSVSCSFASQIFSPVASDL